MKLKKILAATLVGAMVLTNVPVGNHGTAVAVAAENQEVTTSVTTGYELKEISQETLKSNASANSENANPTGTAQGGPAQWAFDEQNHWWHSHFTTGHPSADNPIYIQTGFGETKRIKKLTYTPRTDDKGGIIKNYEVKVSNVVAPSESDWKSVKTGEFKNIMTPQEVVLDNAEDARWIRLVATSNHPKDKFGHFATAKKIQVFEEVPVQVEGVALSKNRADLTIGGTVTLTATVTPANASQEVVWDSDNKAVATVENGVVTAHKAGTALITASSTMYPDKKATCEVVVTRDDSALDAAIKEAEAKMAEEGFEDKYTKASKDELKADLAMARQAKEDPNMTPADVQEVVNSLKASIDGLELKAVVTINNNGEKETKYCEVGEQVKVVAKQAPAGQKFSHWAVDGKAICYNPSYTFTVYKDTEVKSVYIPESETVQKEVSVLCNVSYENGMVKFVSKHSVPTDAGYKVLKVGVVATDQIGYNKIESAGSELTLNTTETTRLKKYGMATNLFLANYTKYLKTSTPNTWYARGYVTYQDEEGVKHTEYSELSLYTIK